MQPTVLLRSTHRHVVSRTVGGGIGPSDAERWKRTRMGACFFFFLNLLAMRHHTHPHTHGQKSSLLHSFVLPLQFLHSFITHDPPRHDHRLG